jgi:hypothetical protein
MNDEIIIIDNALPESKVEQLESELFNERFTWHYLDDITTPGAILKPGESTPGFSHTFMANGVILSRWFKLISDIPPYINSYVGITKYTLNNARTFMHLAQRGLTRPYDKVHIDQERSHIVFLYYLNDSEGETVMFGKHSSDPETNRVTPKRNRVVVFDGSIYHASTQPPMGKRVVINFNIINPIFK